MNGPVFGSGPALVGVRDESLCPPVLNKTTAPITISMAAITVQTTPAMINAYFLRCLSAAAMSGLAAGNPMLRQYSCQRKRGLGVSPGRTD